MRRQFFHTCGLAALVGVACAAAACKRPSPGSSATPPPSGQAPVITPEPPAPGAMARPAPPDPAPSAAPAAPPPARCRALVNLSVQPRFSRFPSPHVVELRIDEKISMATAPGLVLQDAQGLLSIQLIEFETKERTRLTGLWRQWTSVVARRLPGGPPVVWVDGEPEPTLQADTTSDWFHDRTLEVQAAVGPYVSFLGRDQLSAGAIYAGDSWPAFTLAAPGGQRVALPALVGDDAMAELNDRIPVLSREPLGDRLDGFALSWRGVDEGPRGLSLQLGSDNPSQGPLVAFDGLPRGLAPHLTPSPPGPVRIGHPRGCASIGMTPGLLQVQRPGEPRAATLMLPPSMRQATLLGVAWLALDDPFTLSQLAPSGRATDRALAAVAPPVKFHFK